MKFNLPFDLHSRKSHKKRKLTKKKKQQLLLFLCAVGSSTVLLSVLLIFLISTLGDKGQEEIVVIEEEDIPAKEEETVEEPEPEPEPEPEKDFPAPEYEFNVEEVVIEVPGLTQEYSIAWVSDLHMVTDTEASEYIAEEFIPAIMERYEGLSVTPEGIHARELWPEVVKFLNYGAYDGIIMGGDMLDYYSPQNIKVFQEEFEKLDEDVPVMYIRADHDYGAYYGGDKFGETEAYEAHRQIDGDDLEHKYLDFDEFRIVGVNGSTKDMGKEQLAIMEEQFAMDKPIVVATHVPYASKVDDSLSELSMQVRNTIYYWSKEDGSRFVPNDTTNDFIHMIRDEGSPVSQVLAGHLHASWDGEMREGLPEHIFAPAYTGTVGVIHVIPEGGQVTKQVKNGTGEMNRKASGETEDTSEETEATSGETEGTSEETEATSGETEATSEETEGTSEKTEDISENKSGISSN